MPRGDTAIRPGAYLPTPHDDGEVASGTSGSLTRIGRRFVSDQIEMLSRLRAIAGIAEDEPCDSDTLIGILQRFRPDGSALLGLFDDLPNGAPLAGRLQQLYSVAGDSTRPGGGRDAYFIVRTPPQADVDQIHNWASQWLGSLHALAIKTGFDELAQAFGPLPKVRVLEGIAPKHIKSDLDTLPLYRAFKKQGAELVQRLPTESSIPSLLGPAYYYAACDWALRDYLLWPIYEAASELNDPFEPYFQLWRHGAKLRSFSDDTIDVYLPHGDE